MSSFAGKVAIITGGASGIGRALCEALADQKAVVISIDIKPQTTTAWESIQADVSNFEQLNAAIQQVFTRHGRLDFMFNNAAIAVVGELRDSSPEHWRKVVDVNLMGVIYGSLATYKLMAQQGSGHIVNISSVTGLMATPILTPYSTTKWGIIGFSVALRPEAATLGIRISAACPSLVRTNIADGGVYLKVCKEDYLALLPQRWMLEPAQAARAILRGVAKNRGLIVFPWHGKLLWWLYRLSPRLLGPFSAFSVKQWRKLRRAT
ncbi:MAG TPA: SDR family oxidoreductase [Candidatus Binatia bacterium]|nr:SDR family oxidoreductase [Candidatus Binatia bacterium]